ncbi:hypothetical protein HDU83_005579 [Entophlyctis luteolus]|nr:hypothetical protein HDU83_005579 [Entophlyctis luteolus]
MLAGCMFAVAAAFLIVSGIHALSGPALRRAATRAAGIDPDDRAALVAAGCFVDPATTSVPLAASATSSPPTSVTGVEAWDALHAECSAVQAAQLAECPIPNAFHAVMVNMSFQFHHYIALKSVHDIVRPFAIYAIEEFNLILIPSRQATAIFGTPILHKEHESDILRLETLMAHGGVYADLDVWFLKPLHSTTRNAAGASSHGDGLASLNVARSPADGFDKRPPAPPHSFLTNHETVLGREDTARLGNGLIMAKRCARFVVDWYKQYLQFDNKGWGSHSLHVPNQMYGYMYRDVPHLRDAIHVDEDRLQKPNWADRRLIHDADAKGKWNFSNNYAVHLWWKEYIKSRSKLDFDTIKTVNDTVGVLGRYILWGDKSKSLVDGEDY